MKVVAFFFKLVAVRIRRNRVSLENATIRGLGEPTRGCED